MTGEKPDQAVKLRGTVAAFPGQGFAVLDGARFDDFPRLCRRERLFARSLFLDHADAEVEKAGPWLVGLGQAPDALDRVLELVGEEPAAVYWCCAAGEAVLYRHLRTLNMAQIPTWAAGGGTAAPADGAGQEPVPVMFRHWDPRVLGALLPGLDGAQFARVLGPAAEIAFLAVDHGGVRRVVADAALPRAPGGLLAIRSDQIEALNARRLAASHRRTASYLREVAPEVFDGMPDDSVMAFVRYGYESGCRLGLTTEPGHRRWAYMLMASGGRVLDTPGAVAFIRNGRAPPDDQVATALRLVARQLEAGHGDGAQP